MKQAVSTKLVSERGQATIELVVVLPVLIVLAAIALNALTFLNECAAFDRVFPQVVRVHAGSLGYGQTELSAAESIAATLGERMDGENISTDVAVLEDSAGNAVYTGTIRYTPTLFGLAFRTEVFGVSMPALSHSASYAVSLYRPGVIG